MSTHNHAKSSEAYETGPFGTIRYGRDEMVQHEHPIASGAADVEPGMLVERVEENGEIHVQPHSTDGGTGKRYVAIEARGRGMNALDGAYAESGDQYVKYVAVSGGGMNLLVASGETVAVGDALVSSGDGTLRAAAGDGTESGAHVFEVASSVDNSGGSNAVFVPTEVL